jgi:hypothetical protein
VSAPKIPELYRLNARCRICKNPEVLAYVDAQLTRGMTATFIALFLTDKMSTPTTPNIVLSHKKHFIAPLPEQAAKKEDLAILVRDRTVEAIREGRLEPTISHGLQAQALIDRRTEKTNDQNLMLAMARALSGGPAGYLEPPDDLIIEGEAVPVE